MRIIQENTRYVDGIPRLREQNCAQCIYADRCYAQSASPRNVVLNILACRVRNGIDRNKSATQFIEMIESNVLKLVHHAKARVGSGYVDIAELKRDLESRIIECLIDPVRGFNIGSPAFLTEYMFGLHKSTGWVRKWILWGFSKQNKFFKRHRFTGYNPDSDQEETIPEEDRKAIALAERNQTPDVYDQSNNALEAIKAIVWDGYTLNTNEFRVFAFCMTHSNPTNKVRLIDGMHMYMADIMGVSRPRCTKLFSCAKLKIIEEANRRGIKL